MARQTIFELLFDDNAAPGQLVAGEGVFVGRYELPVKGLRRAFNVYAAPQDLADANDGNKAFTYREAVYRVAALRDWNGFDGENYANSNQIHQALQDGSYEGGWVIPPRELLSGMGAETPSGERKPELVGCDNLFDLRQKGAFSNTFTTVAADAYNEPACYWSSTLDDGYHGPDFALNVDFSDGYESLGLVDSRCFSCRPVRFVPVK